MDPLISIPREALAELLRASGSTLTPEEYVASLSGPVVSKKFRSRAWAAAISKYCLLVIAVLGVVTLPFLGFTLENLVIVAGLATVTYFEFRVHRYFREGNPAAPDLGFRNESCFAAAILIYCLYSAFAPLPHDAMTMVEENNVIDAKTLQSLMRTFYFSVAVIAGGSQFALALYYRTAKS